jgi:hypothetical protein
VGINFWKSQIRSLMVFFPASMWRARPVLGVGAREEEPLSSVSAGLAMFGGLMFAWLIYVAEIYQFTREQDIGS